MKNSPEIANAFLDTSECRATLDSFRRYAAKQFPGLQMDDLQDAITDASQRAAESFNASFGTQFLTHLNNVLRRALFDAHKRHIRRVRLGKTVDLDKLDPLPEDDDAHSIRAEDLTSGDDANELLIKRAEMVSKALRPVPERDKKIFIHYYGGQATCRELAAEWGLKKSRVQQIATGVMNRVRAYMVTHKDELQEKA
jgi:RNA polymerase sigma factor (sigma-70 family)